MKRKQIMFPGWLDEYINEGSKQEHLNYSELVRIACCSFIENMPKFESREEAKRFVDDVIFNFRLVVKQKKDKKKPPLQK